MIEISKEKKVYRIKGHFGMLRGSDGFDSEALVVALSAPKAIAKWHKAVAVDRPLHVITLEYLGTVYD